MAKPTNQRYMLLGGVLLAVVVVVAWLMREGDTPPWTAGKARDRAIPVIIYLVDTLRADRLGLYGYDRPTSAAIDRLAMDSVIFDQAYAPAPWTTPSVTSLFTSTFVCEHQMTQRKKLSPELRTLAERLNGIGYETGAFIANPLVGELTGLNRGYTTYMLREELNEEARLADVNRFLDRVGRKPYLLYLHTMEPHEPHTTPARFIARFGQFSAEQLTAYHDAMLRYYGYRHADWKLGNPLGTSDYTAEQDAAMDYFVKLGDTVDLVYDASVLHASSNVSNLVAILKERGMWDKAVFIFMSDHGEELGEHGGWFHGQSMYEELARVPLIMHFPRGEFGGRRITTPVSLVDVMPTILDYLGLSDACEACRGSSLMPHLRRSGEGFTAAPRVLGMRFNRVNYYRPWKESRGDLNVVLRQDQWKGIWNVQVESMELYDLHQDPGEIANVSGDRTTLAQSLRQRAVPWLEDCRNRATVPTDVEHIDPETEEQLRALGYLN